ncbi:MULTISPECIES: SIMPL domain-containing protein [unclassified Moraxella]|uniref:SIMPL domain-containing protein n=1 Tax=unclassified Moraxella TaxID=2685852 RepID=UPI003AF9BD49
MTMLKKLALTSALALTTLTSLPATAMPTGNAMTTNTLNYGLLNFSASASRKVDNDQINASLNKTVQNKSSSEVANQIAKTLNQAVSIAKKYPNVQVTTGNQSTYPQYDKNQKIIGWIGNANLNLKSTDTVATSKLIAELQSFMTMDNLNFSVSDELQKKVEKELTIEASKEFQEQAKALLPVWNARDYQLVNLEFNQSGGSYGRAYAQPVMMMAEAGSAKVADQNFQAGESTLSVTANGQVQLVK